MSCRIFRKRLVANGVNAYSGASQEFFLAKTISRSFVIEVTKCCTPVLAPFLPTGTERANYTPKSREPRSTMVKRIAPSTVMRAMVRTSQEKDFILNGTALIKFIWLVIGEFHSVAAMTS